MYDILFVIFKLKVLLDSVIILYIKLIYLLFFGNGRCKMIEKNEDLI